MTSLVIIIILVVLVAWAIALYNRIITLENRYGNAWSQIDVQLKRRTDLIPNLVEVVKGYAAHEKGIFEELAASRAAMMGAKNVAESAEAANQMSAALGRLFAISENYPDLKANQNFMMLQEELTRIWQERRPTVLFITHDVGEAVFLAERVVVLSKGKILGEVAVDLPRPRGWDLLIEDAAFKALSSRVLQMVRSA